MFHQDIWQTFPCGQVPLQAAQACAALLLQYLASCLSVFSVAVQCTAVLVSCNLQMKLVADSSQD